MIRVTVDTEEEVSVVRRIVKSEVCSHKPCSPVIGKSCDECLDEYCKDKVILYKREIVETNVPLVV